MQYFKCRLPLVDRLQPARDGKGICQVRSLVFFSNGLSKVSCNESNSIMQLVCEPPIEGVAFTLAVRRVGDRETYQSSTHLGPVASDSSYTLIQQAVNMSCMSATYSREKHLRKLDPTSTCGFQH